MEEKTGEQLIGEDMKGRYHGLIDGTILVSAWRTEENHEKFQSGYLISTLRSETSTSQH